MWKPVRLFAFKKKFDFLGQRRAALIISTLINIVSIVGVLTIGLNFGIDFKGGIAIQAKAKDGKAELDQLRNTVGALGVGEVSLQEFGDPSTVLIRVQRQEGDNQCVAGAQRVMLKRAGTGWQVKPGAAGTGDVEFTSPAALDAANWRDAVSRAGLTIQERQLPRGQTNTAKIDMSVEQRAEWCQQVAIKLVEDAIGSNYELRGTESVGPKIGDELMRSGIWAVIAPRVGIGL